MHTKSYNVATYDTYLGHAGTTILNLAVGKLHAHIDLVKRSSGERNNRHDLPGRRFRVCAGGASFDGGRTYRLRVPPNPPAKQFWSITLYDVDTRRLIQNAQQIADRSSRNDLVKNADGSIDLYFGPAPPTGFEKNWIPTVAGRAWFTYFRLFGLLEPYLDQSWFLPDIEPVK